MRIGVAFFGEGMERETKLLHLAEHYPEFKGATQVPIFQTSAFAHESAEALEAVFAGTKAGFAYTRIGNPTVNHFELCMAQLEGGFAATACSSGSAAIACTLLNLLKTGDEIIVPTGLYGGTLDFFKDIGPLGIRAVFAEDFSAENVRRYITDNTRAIFAEAIGNPKLNVVDITALAALAHSYDIPLIIDSTTATPVLVNPLQLGADLVIHSSSKYINGNGSAISGVIVDGASYNWNNGKYEHFGDYLRFGKMAFTARLKNSVWRDIGACLAPMNAFLNSNGLETLSLRMERICANAKALADFLTVYGEVNYPYFRYRSLCEQQFYQGMAGGILTLRLGTKERAFRVINRLQFALNASNIGDSKTLVVHPASTIFAHSTKEQQAQAGVFDDMIRISVGIENIADLLADFENALKE